MSDQPTVIRYEGATTSLKTRQTANPVPPVFPTAKILGHPVEISLAKKLQNYITHVPS